MDAWISMSSEAQHFFRITHAEGRTGRATIYNGELIKSTLVVIVQFNEELLP